MFIANVPKQIDGPDYPHLKGFPYNLFFTSVVEQNGKTYLRSSLYWPEVETFLETNQEKQLDYANELGGPHRLRVKFNKSNGYWLTEKYSGDKLIRIAGGPDFEKAMIQTTIGGHDD